MKTAIGLMSGTSMDGIDVALVRTDGLKNVEFGPSLAVDYPASVRRRLEEGLTDAMAIEERSDRPGALVDLETEVTRLHADAVQQFLSVHGLSAGEIDLIGFHGQTVLHRPDEGLTVQLGKGQALADAVGIDVVYDMRAADMQSGGQGAPLVPVFHQALTWGDIPVCWVNIGGISNITYVHGDELIAFDTGPGNALIDQWVQAKGGIPFDQGGKIASEGGVIDVVLKRYLDAPFFNKAGPKSLDRNDFLPLGAEDAELADGARTLARLTAEAIFKAVEHLPQPPEQWIICGGGRLNETIMADLKTLALVQDAIMQTADERGLDGDMLEAQAFGYLAVRSTLGLPLTFPTTTGCAKAVSGGVMERAETKTEAQASVQSS